MSLCHTHLHFSAHWVLISGLDHTNLILGSSAHDSSVKFIYSDLVSELRVRITNSALADRRLPDKGFAQRSNEYNHSKIFLLGLTLRGNMTFDPRYSVSSRLREIRRIISYPNMSDEVCLLRKRQESYRSMLNIIYKGWELNDRIEIGSQSSFLSQYFSIKRKKTPKSRRSPANAFPHCKTRPLESTEFATK